MFSLLIAAALAQEPTRPAAAVDVKNVAIEVLTATNLQDQTKPSPHVIIRVEGNAPFPSAQDVRLVVTPEEVARGDGFLELTLTADHVRMGVRDVTLPVRAAAIGVVVPGMSKGVRVRGADGTVAEARVEGLPASPRQSPDQVAPAPGSGIPDRARAGMSPPPPKDPTIKTLTGFVVIDDKGDAYYLEASTPPTLAITNYLIDTGDPAMRAQLRSASPRRVPVIITGRVSDYPAIRSYKIHPETIEELKARPDR